MERRASQVVLASPFTWFALLSVVGLEIAFYRWFHPPITLAALMIGLGGMLLLIWPVLFLRSQSFHEVYQDMPYKSDVSDLQKRLKSCHASFRAPAEECIVMIEKIQQEFQADTFRGDLERIIENLMELTQNHLQLTSRLERFGTPQQKQLMQNILDQQVRSVENSLTTLRAFSGNLTLLEANPEDIEKIGSDLRTVNQELEHVIQKEV